LIWSCRVVSKFHYTDPQTLSATRPDPRTKSVHVEIEKKSTTRQSPRTLSETRSDFVGDQVVEFRHQWLIRMV